MFALLSYCVLMADPDTGGASGLCWGDSGGEAGEDAAAHRVLPPFTAAQPGWSGAPSRPLPGRLSRVHICQLSCIHVHICLYLLNNSCYG